ncbi:MAG TPA: VanZ family protein [Desulfobacterales bacterium]|nr:VanZ family protein [Desulfobacterales bacterium]
MSKRLKNFMRYWFPVLIYCLLIIIQSSRPSPECLPHLPYMDKFLHFAGYGLLGALFLRAYKTLSMRNRTGLLVTISILSAFIFGITDEIHQYYVPRRSSDLMDLMADLLGSAFGVFLYQLIHANRYHHAAGVSE